MRSGGKPKILLFHNILWSKYKAGVYSETHTLALERGLQVGFVQIAETDHQRRSLTQVDYACHRYPYDLLFEGTYEDVGLVSLTRRVFATIWNSGADLVVLPGYHKPEYWAGLLACRVRRVVTGVFCDSTAFDQPHSWAKTVLKRLFFSQCDLVLTYGERSMEYVCSFGVPRDKVAVRCQAALLDADYHADAIPSQRALLAPPATQLNILYVGRLSEEKGTDLLLTAFARVHEVDPLARLVLVGSGPQQECLISMARELGVEAAVDFLGAMQWEGVRDHYLKASCLVLPSRSEAWGLVVNEALAFGCPVVASSHCGCIPELVHEGATGLVFESGNPADLAQKLLAVKETFRDQEATALRCLQLISGFTPRHAAEAILDGCEAALTRKARRPPRA